MVWSGHGSVCSDSGVPPWLTPRVVGFALGWLAVCFIGGWFVYDVCARKGPANSEFRMYVVIALSLAAAVILAMPVKKSVTP